MNSRFDLTKSSTYCKFKIQIVRLNTGNRLKNPKEKEFDNETRYIYRLWRYPRRE